MTTLQKLQVRQSEIREKINGLLGNDARTEEQDAELVKLTAAGQAIEPEIRAALIAEPDPETTITNTGDPETRERLELRSRTGIADFLCAAAGGREVSGAAREYADACGVSPLGRLPLELFGNGNPETRAITAAPAVDGRSKRQFPTCSSAAPALRSVSKCRRMAQGKRRFHG